MNNSNIHYTTAGVVPSNSIGNRVFVLTLSAELLPSNSSQYILKLDFTNVQTEREINLEGPIDGQLNICGKTYNATRYCEYTLEGRKLIIKIESPIKVKKHKKNMYLNIQINDSSLCSGITYYDSTYSVNSVEINSITSFINLDFSVQPNNKINYYGYNVMSMYNTITFGPLPPPPNNISNNTLYLQIEMPSSNFQFNISDIGNYTQIQYNILTQPYGQSYQYNFTIQINNFTSSQINFNSNKNMSGCLSLPTICSINQQGYFYLTTNCMQTSPPSLGITLLDPSLSSNEIWIFKLISMGGTYTYTFQSYNSYNNQSQYLSYDSSSQSVLLSSNPYNWILNQEINSTNTNNFIIESDSTTGNYLTTFGCTNDCDLCIENNPNFFYPYWNIDIISNFVF